VLSTVVIFADDSALTSQRWKENTMSKIDELKTDIERLSSEEAAELFRWLSEREWESWDKEMEADSQSGRLDFLVREALHEKAKGTLKEL
jgi:hypothetical protein